MDDFRPKLILNRPSSIRLEGKKIVTTEIGIEEKRGPSLK
jgi:hypothetical protein